jgi:hypothetical protein
LSKCVGRVYKTRPTLFAIAKNAHLTHLLHTNHRKPQLTPPNPRGLEMLQRTFMTVIIIVATVSVGTAGTISNGTWSASACGIEPEVPVIRQDSVETYNQSIKTINEWQQKANAYNTCVINEANANNAIIAKTATDQQNKFRATVEKIKIATDAAKAKLESQ